MAQLTALLGETLQTKAGEKPTAEVLDGKEVVGLYFSAHWCGPCRSFTPKLAEAYGSITAAGKAFEIVFVSSDRDASAFDEYYAEMPWSTLPYAARDVKAKLSKKFKVSGIPTLVLLDGRTGKTLTTDGRATLMEDPTGREFPWPAKTVHELLGGPEGELLSHADDVSVADLEGKTLALYFSAHWCPPCKAFTPKLVETYKAMRGAGRDDMEFIFVSSDRSTQDFGAYFGEMPWLAIPNGDKRVSALSRHFNVEGIPTLVTVGPDGKTINAEARGAIGADPSGANFPWPRPPVANLKDGPAGLNESTSLVVLAEGLGGAEQEAVRGALESVAKAARAKAEAEGEDEPPFLFFIGTGGEDPVSPQIRKLAKLPEPSAAAPHVVLLDIPDEGGYYTMSVGGAAELTAGALQAMLDDFAAGKLDRQQLGG